jgi:hypothetical protein
VRSERKKGKQQRILFLALFFSLVRWLPVMSMMFWTRESQLLEDATVDDGAEGQEVYTSPRTQSVLPLT